MSEKQRQALSFVLATLIALSVARFGYALYLVHSLGFGDFYLFWEQTLSFLDTGRLYPYTSLAAYEPGASVFKFPPLYAVFLIPPALAGVGHSIFDYHFAVQLTLYLAFVGMAVFMFRGRKPWLAAALIAIMSFSFEPFIESIDVLQLEVPFLTLLTLCLFCFQRGKDGWAGALLGLCAMLKIYPGFLLLFFVVRRRWRVVIAFGASAASLLIVNVLVVGLRETSVYYFEVLPVLLGETSIVTLENLGIGRYLQSLLGLGAGPAKALGTLAALPFLVVSALAVHANRDLRSRGNLAALEFSLFIPVMLLWMPNSWVNYQLLLLLPMAVVVGCSVATVRERAAPLALVSAAYLLTLFSEMTMHSAYLLRLIWIPQPLLNTMIGFRVCSTLMVWAAVLLVLKAVSSEERTAAG